MNNWKLDSMLSLLLIINKEYFCIVVRYSQHFTVQNLKGIKAALELETQKIWQQV
jgi:hypothetical protein